MTLTKQEAIENHREMWNWIADELEKGNGDKYYGDLHYMKTRYFHLHNIKPEDRPRTYGYCCEYLYSIKISSCRDCPLKWPGGRCISYNRLYENLMRKKDYTEAAKLARQIANLPEREDV